MDLPPERCAVCFDWCDAFDMVPSPAIARQTPERRMARPIKKRRLRNADCEPDFFFIVYDDLGLVVKESMITNLSLGRQDNF